VTFSGSTELLNGCDDLFVHVEYAGIVYRKSRPLGRLFVWSNVIDRRLEIQIVAGNGCFDPLLTGVHPFF
jgi:hypothetical protein